VQASLLRAKAEFMQADRDLLVVNANERSMTHKFAEYLQKEFPTWNVDCEYNRVGTGDTPKELDWLREQIVRADDENAKTVYPDIIVHHRKQRENLLVIEAKKSGRDNSDDLQKLKAFTDDPQYRYKFAVSLCFVTGEASDVTFERR